MHREGSPDPDADPQMAGRSQEHPRSSPRGVGDLRQALTDLRWRFSLNREGTGTPIAAAPTHTRVEHACWVHPLFSLRKCRRKGMPAEY